jgi:hypothetical protein
MKETKMFVKNLIADIKLTRKVRRERAAIAAATERVLRDQQVRSELLTYLEVNDMLKPGKVVA